ncbi:hypothetical protein [Actinoplanes sp. NBRC 101535]|uniref:hypothetical protein n=1 Tax=Actinoplanes sp. NBRC 101535 TaxID=3032196 RepID=UPI0024A0C678|nr:hypothetical protein [Actinoplanes sp. NBRC 101535]GLY00662.1 hypothetical protein Acsp01_10410 [Actinoplanes sp. NBRC 101535]
MPIHELDLAARKLIAANQEDDRNDKVDAMRTFAERVTFASADEILSVLREIAAEDWIAMPPWARNLAFRLACLQRPTDVAILREAAADLLSFGPDWDAHAFELQSRADQIEDTN